MIITAERAKWTRGRALGRRREGAGTAAATGFVITSLHQIKPRVVRQLQGGPGYAVYNDSGRMVPAGDSTLHNLATLTIPRAGAYAADAKVIADDPGSYGATPTCTLTAHTTGGGGNDVDTSVVSLDSGSDANGFGNQQVIPTEVVHTFSSPGTITLACYTGSTESGHGVQIDYSDAKIIAVGLTSLKNQSVSH